jgi:hypothetical protein
MCAAIDCGLRMGLFLCKTNVEQLNATIRWKICTRKVPLLYHLE